MTCTVSTRGATACRVVPCRIAPRRVVSCVVSRHGGGGGGAYGGDETVMGGWTVMGQTQSPAHNDGTGTTRGGGRGSCHRRRRLSTAPVPPEAGVCASLRERSASAARAHRASVSARQHAEASRVRQKPRRRDRAAQLDVPRLSRSPTRRGSTPHAARGRRRCRRSQRPVARAKSQNRRACAYADAAVRRSPTRAVSVAQSDAA